MPRGNARQDIFLDDDDRQVFINHLVRVCQRFDWRVWAWCLMGNHYHWLIETHQPTLAKFHSQLAPARRAYARFVRDGIGEADPYDAMQRAGIFGDETFIERVLDHVDLQALSAEIVRKDRPAASLQTIAQRHKTRDDAIQEAYSTGAYTTLHYHTLKISRYVAHESSRLDR